MGELVRGEIRDVVFESGRQRSEVLIQDHARRMAVGVVPRTAGIVVARSKQAGEFQDKANLKSTFEIQTAIESEKTTESPKKVSPEIKIETYKPLRFKSP